MKTTRRKFIQKAATAGVVVAVSPALANEIVARATKPAMSPLALILWPQPPRITKCYSEAYMQALEKIFACKTKADIDKMLRQFGK